MEISEKESLLQHIDNLVAQIGSLDKLRDEATKSLHQAQTHLILKDKEINGLKEVIKKHESDLENLKKEVKSNILNIDDINIEVDQSA